MHGVIRFEAGNKVEIMISYSESLSLCIFMGFFLEMCFHIFIHDPPFFFTSFLGKQNKEITGKIRQSALIFLKIVTQVT